MASTASPPARRKPKIKPVRPTRTEPSNTFTQLHHAIQQIQNHNASRLSFEEHYRYAYNAVIHQQGAQLHGSVSDQVAKHLTEEAEKKIVPVMTEVAKVVNKMGWASSGGSGIGNGEESESGRGGGALDSLDGDMGMEMMVHVEVAERFLKSIRNVWDDHVATMKKLRDLLKYMDKVYAPSHQVLTVWDLGLSHYLTHVIQYPFSNNAPSSTTGFGFANPTPSSSSNSTTRRTGAAGSFAAFPKTNANASSSTSVTGSNSPMPPRFSSRVPKDQYLGSIQHHLLQTLLLLIKFERISTAPTIITADPSVASTSASAIGSGSGSGSHGAAGAISLTRHTLKSTTDMLSNLIDGRIVSAAHASTSSSTSSSLSSQNHYSSQYHYGSSMSTHHSNEGVALDGESVYKREFEPLFLEETRWWYESEGVRLLTSLSAPVYLSKIETRLQQEESRCRQYLQSNSTLPLLTSLLEHVLIEVHLEGVMSHKEGGLGDLLEGDRREDLERMYRLFGRVERKGHEMLRVAVGEWIKEKGGSINVSSGGGSGGDGEGAGKNKGKAKQDDTMDTGEGGGSGKGGGEKGQGPTNAALAWVKNVLELKDKFETILRVSWNEDKTFLKAVDDAFETFINRNAKAAEFISLFLDENLRKGTKGKSESEVDAALDKTLLLFRYLQAKDIFEKYYKKHLAKRLMYQRSVSEDAERGMLAKLRIESGAQFTRDLEGMLKDMKISEDMTADYKKHVNKSGSTKPPMDLAIQVLTSSFWPISVNAPTKCLLPDSFAKTQDLFERFYQHRHSGRRLTWHAQFGTVDIKIKFKARTHEFNVTTHTAVVLLAFSNDDRRTFEDLVGTTDLPVPELKRVLQSLANGRYRVLTKDPKGREVEEGDKFAFNSAFKSDQHRLKIQPIANKVETGDERKETIQKVEEERRLVTEAAIVRVMKNRKSLVHNDLITEVTRQLTSRFHVQPRQIKLAVEKLIEKEYLERDENDSKTLKYLA